MDVICSGIMGLLVGYFVIGEWFCGTILGWGRHHHYPWEKR
jgi:hypothetical protein